METLNPTENQPIMEAAPLKRRYRKSGKRKTGFMMTTPAFPVRAIWEMATPEEQQEAHKMGILMLEHWLGRMTRRELGERINLPPLRIWQMSQQALAGMVVGLMNQPKRPPRGTLMPKEEKKLDREEIKNLRQENQELKRDVQALKDLLFLVEDLPLNVAKAKVATALAAMPQGKKKEPQNSSPNPLSGKTVAPKP